MTGGTHLQRDGHFTAKQMSVTGHKSVQNLAVYQRVKEDEKLEMGMSLTYSLLNPEEVQETTTAMAKHLDYHTNTTNPVSVNTTPPALLPSSTNPVTPVQNQSQPHALDPNIPQLVPLDSALVPYEPSNKENTAAKEFHPSFDLMSSLAELDAPNDDQLVLAASQIENQSTKKSTMLRKQQNPLLSILLATVPLVLSELSIFIFTSIKFMKKV